MCVIIKVPVRVSFYYFYRSKRSPRIVAQANHMHTVILILYYFQLDPFDGRVLNKIDNNLPSKLIAYGCVL